MRLTNDNGESTGLSASESNQSSLRSLAQRASAVDHVGPTATGNAPSPLGNRTLFSLTELKSPKAT